VVLVSVPGWPQRSHANASDMSVLLLPPSKAGVSINPPQTLAQDDFRARRLRIGTRPLARGEAEGSLCRISDLVFVPCERHVAPVATLSHAEKHQWATGSYRVRRWVRLLHEPTRERPACDLLGQRVGRSCVEQGVARGRAQNSGSSALTISGRGPLNGRGCMAGVTLTDAIRSRGITMIARCAPM
jgi:hypothetical protein